MHTLIFILTCLFTTSLVADPYNTAPAERENGVIVFDLKRAINTALTSSRKLAYHFDAIEISEMNLDIAASEFDWQIFPRADSGFIGGGSAGFGVTFGAGVYASKKFGCGTKISVNPSIEQGGNAFNANLRTSISQPLLRGFSWEYTMSPYRGAQFAQRNTYRALYKAQINLILQAIQYVYEIARNKAFVELDKESLERIKKFCGSTKMKEKMGLCDAMDVYRAEIELKRAEDALDQSQDRLLDTIDSFKDLLTIPQDVEIDVDVEIEYEKVNIDLDYAIDVALGNRVEMDQAEDNLSEARRLSRISKENLKPDLNLVVDYTSFAYDEVFTRAFTTKRQSRWGIGFTTSTDWDKTRDSAVYDQSKLTIDEQERNLDQTHDNIVMEVKKHLRMLNRAEYKIALQEEQIENSQKEYRLAKLKFEHGLANNFDLIQAEKNLRQAESQMLSAIIEHRIGEFKLLAILGTLVDKPAICK